jgi:putative transcriptional regulator
MQNLAGHLLIAVPELADTNFFRTVVILFQHDQDGAAGLVLNRKMNVTLADVWKEVASETVAVHEPLYLGGPVEGPLMALHASLTLAEMQVVPGVFFSMQRDNLSRLIKQSQHEFRIFSGYSGWDYKQLENELHLGGWMTMQAEREHVFAQPEELWKSVCEKFGHEIMLTENLRNRLPIDPSVN